MYSYSSTVSVVSEMMFRDVEPSVYLCILFDFSIDFAVVKCVAVSFTAVV